MHYFRKLAVVLAAFSIIDPSSSHPGEVHNAAHHKRELKMRDHLTSHSKRALDTCQNSLESQNLKRRAIERRVSTARMLQEKRGLPTKVQTEHPEDCFWPFGNAGGHKRDLAELQVWEEHSHEKNHTGYTACTPESVIFGAKTSCVLTPEDTVGPYYVSGELIRSNLVEDQPGIPMHLELQFIDTSNCKPLPQLAVDVWACNSTGVYSGIDPTVWAGEAGLNSTYLRGIQITDHDGVVEFDTLFPGHYTGRATHQHVITHLNSTILPNGTISTDGAINHIGQLFFDEALRAEIEKTYPYNTNTQAVVSNDDDMWAPVAASADYDPIVEYVMLGEKVEDGLLAWISIGVNVTANYTELAYIASYWTEDGGENNADDGFLAAIRKGMNSTSSSTALATPTA